MRGVVMKKGFIFILILVVLFVGAILIYDFSDIPSEMLAGHDWYLIENNDVYVLNLENNKFSFKNKNNDEERYKNCNTYKYNNSTYLNILILLVLVYREYYSYIFHIMDIFVFYFLFLHLLFLSFNEKRIGTKLSNS